MSRLMMFEHSVERDPAVENWMRRQSGELGTMALRWFSVMRDCGSDVRELLHDGDPTACVGDAAFCYVNAFKQHVNVGFFLGAEMDDPDELLQGEGKFMRHVKIRPDELENAKALENLVRASYADMRKRSKL